MAHHSSVLAWRIPGMGGAWWASVYGVAQSRTQLEQLSSSSSSSKLHLTLCDPMDYNMPDSPVLHCLPEFAVAIQLSRPLPPPSPPAINLFPHRGLSQWVSSLHQVAKVLELQLQHQSFWFPLGWTNYSTKQKCSWPLCWKGHEQYSWPFGVLLMVLIYHI